MLIGYARVSTEDQTLNLQLDALAQAGCERVFTDTASGAKADRIGLAAALSFARDGDTLVVWRLDRLGRSTCHLIDTLEAMRERGIGFRSLREGFDTTTPMGRMVFTFTAALAEFERDVTRERTMAGLEAARARGRKGGRKHKLTSRDMGFASATLRARTLSPSDLAARLGISTATLYRYVGPDGELRKMLPR